MLHLFYLKHSFKIHFHPPFYIVCPLENCINFSVCLLKTSTNKLWIFLFFSGTRADFTQERSAGRVLKSPTFLATPQELSVPVGSDVSFPCDFDSKGNEGRLYTRVLQIYVCYAHFTPVYRIRRKRMESNKRCLPFIIDR